MIDGSIVGRHSKIGPGVKMGPGFRIGEGVFVGPNVVLCNDMWPRADDTGFELDRLLDGSLVTIIIGDGASIGANATVLPGTHIGKNAFVAAGAVVDCDIPDGHIFKRSGEIVELNTAWARRRMRAARTEAPKTTLYFKD
jgi:acetyltransferase-like isoleucine patch superfamily enzyme